MFKTPNLRNKIKGTAFVAVLASVLWAVHPIQTQAVTYIVQRMAQMAAMFYIIAMYAYIKGRITNLPYKKAAWFIGCFFCFIFAIGSKENSAMLPISLILIEITFFQNLKDKQIQKQFVLLSLAVIIMIFLFGTFAFMRGNPLSFIESYNHRSFSFTERLFAQPRIVLYYISQIFYPLPSRFSIAHDVVLSASVFKPWTTIPSILIIFALISFGLSKLIKMPLLSFSILFFFINHIIESSIIPLELVFEHRNYLPSFFCFLPLALLVNFILQFYKNKSRAIYILTSFFIISIIVFFSISTYVRNKAWQTNITLWSDAAKKAPNNARAVKVLAIELAWGDKSKHPKRYDMAIKLFEKSLQMHIPTKSLKADIIGNMANVYSNNKQNYTKAIMLYKEALLINPGNMKIRKDFVMALVLNNNMAEALKNVDLLILKNDKNEIYHNLKGFILLWLKKNDQALLSFKKTYKLAPPKPNILLNTGVALSLIGNYKSAEKFFLKTIELSPNDMIIFFYLIDNSLRADKKTNAEIYTKKLIELFDNNEILKILNSDKNIFRRPPLSKTLISPFIQQKLSGEKVINDN
jgi:tetratricopeptide (TPR) repeat protein